MLTKLTVQVQVWLLRAFADAIFFLSFIQFEDFAKKNSKNIFRRLVPKHFRETIYRIALEYFRERQNILEYLRERIVSCVCTNAY